MNNIYFIFLFFIFLIRVSLLGLFEVNGRFEVYFIVSCYRVLLSYPLANVSQVNINLLDLLALSWCILRRFLVRVEST
jgi:hypothetical protein